jgi:hypothetical protein
MPLAPISAPSLPFRCCISKQNSIYIYTETHTSTLKMETACNSETPATFPTQENSEIVSCPKQFDRQTDRQTDLVVSFLYQFAYAFLWNATRCNEMGMYGRFGVPCCLHLPGRNDHVSSMFSPKRWYLSVRVNGVVSHKINVERPSETSVSLCTRIHPKRLSIRGCENLRTSTRHSFAVGTTVKIIIIGYTALSEQQPSL